MLMPKGDEDEREVASRMTCIYEKSNVHMNPSARGDCMRDNEMLNLLKHMSCCIVAKLCSRPTKIDIISQHQAVHYCRDSTWTTSRGSEPCKASA